MKKIILLFTFILIAFQSFAGFKIDGSFTKNDKTYFFDFTNDVYLIIDADGNSEGTFDMSSFSSNWVSKSEDMDIDLVFQSPDGSKIYFMDSWNGTYLRHDWDNGSIDSAWPKPLSYFSDNWPSTWTNGTYIADGAFQFGHTIYFFDFSEGKKITYNWDEDSWDYTTNMYNLSPSPGNHSFDYVNQNFKRSSAASFTRNSYVFYSESSKSYIRYSFVGDDDKWAGPFPLTDFNGWDEDWFTPNTGYCIGPKLQTNNGHTLIPLNFDLPEGILNTDYAIKYAQIAGQTNDNSLIKVAVKPPNASLYFNLFNLGVASGTNFGSCSQPVYFKDDAPNLINSGTAPYKNQSFKPQYQFANLPHGQVKGQWYLDVLSTSTNYDVDYFELFNIEFEPKNEIQCGQSVSYHVSAGQGTWDMSQFCGTAQGKEAFWKFTPEYSRKYFMEIEGGDGYGDYYIKDAEDGFNKDGWSCLTSEGYDLSLGNLVAGKTYYLLVKAEQTTGTGEDFSILCPHCNPISNLQLDGVANDALDFVWTKSTSSTNYKWALTSGGSLIKSGTTADNDVSIDGLDRNTSYTFSVQTDCGDGLFSESVSVTVSTSNDCAKPYNLSSDGVQLTSLDFTWSGSNDIDGYAWELKQNNILVDNGSTVETDLNIPNLTPGTEYTFYVKTNCGGGLFSDFVSMNLSTLSCDAPDGLEVTNIQPDGFTITVNDNGSPMKYQVVPSGSGFGNNVIVENEATGTSFPVTGLTAATAYDVYIQTVCAEGVFSEPTSVLNISTLVGTDNLNSIEAIKLSPNPTSNQLNVAIQSIHATTIDISVVNLLGKEIIQKKIRLNTGLNIETLDVSNLVSGAYFIRITEDDKTAGFRFSKK